MKTLVVEDESISQQLLMEVMAGYGVTHVADDGREALTKFQEALREKEHYDLICLDIMMPGLDGQETLRQIRKIEEDSGVTAEEQVKVFMVTALHDDKNIADAYGNGACQTYLTKPINTSILKDRLYEFGLLK